MGGETMDFLGFTKVYRPHTSSMAAGRMPSWRFVEWGGGDGRCGENMGKIGLEKFDQ